MKESTIILALSAAIAATTAGHAGTATGSLTIKAKIVAGCIVSGGTDSPLAGTTLDFGSFSTLDKAHEGSGTISVLCSKGTKYNIGLGPGANGKDSKRYMKSTNGATIQYELYSDATRATVWTAADNTTAKGYTATGKEDLISVFGSVLKQDTAPAADYTDTVTITVNF